jgi:hypothetical protein
MPETPHNKILAIGFAAFAVIFGGTFLLLMLTSLGVFVALGFSIASETGDSTNAGIGIIGGILAVIFYGVLFAIFVFPVAWAGWKLFKLRPRARLWGIIAAILVLPIMPLGTALGVYALWFLFSEQGKRLQLAS